MVPLLLGKIDFKQQKTKEVKGTMSEKIIQLNEGVIKEELNELVRKSVEDTLNTLLDEEADRLTNARRYERTATRKDTRAGHYKRKLLTRAGEVELKMPKLRTLTFETAIIQRYQKREISVEEALVEMYLAGVCCSQSRGHYTSLMGHKGQCRYGQSIKPEGVHPDR